MEDCVGFKVLPVKVNEKSTVVRHLFLKMNTTREKCPQKPEYQTLFVIGVPEFCEEKTLKHAFNHCGKIKSVFFHKEPTPVEPEVFPSKYFVPESIKGYKVAYIVFAHTSGLENALSLKCTESEPLILSTQSAPVTNIITRWCKNYNGNIIDSKAVQSEIDVYMAQYDKMTSERVKVEKELIDEDEDGWKTITKKGRNPGFSRKETTKNNILNKVAKKKIKKTLKNFYRFQIKETKINKLMELRNKFDSDKSKIELLKQIITTQISQNTLWSKYLTQSK
ncbi:Ribosomal RNA-processing protein 7,Rrp7A, RNA recognition motif,RNA recognition motif domain [Cinara cedri]|uniref:Ribosomal RNA-processing protein 7,Rrp7A, RNA recognition motif,RNA recognition motif domain n=1 Tax=Cinara cedri TaxID=506608 RepID=A0A5E4MSE7_9HEMI|nr:Ribosomal RNA-processing protein 7,Rrp7A, RNA recognition motif,RNA recognition motif domain [Cinara cedri]